jgi:hypothetical protein
VEVTAGVDRLVGVAESVEVAAGVDRLVGVTELIQEVEAGVAVGETEEEVGPSKVVAGAIHVKNADAPTETETVESAQEVEVEVEVAVRVMETHIT